MFSLVYVIYVGIHTFYHLFSVCNVTPHYIQLNNCIFSLCNTYILCLVDVMLHIACTIILLILCLIIIVQSFV